MKKIVLLSLAVFAALSLSAQQPRDWAQYGRYEQQNAALAGESVEVVFVDRGISGQTTAVMLARFRRDVIDLNPKAVVILAGINDIAQNNGAIKLENVFGNIVSMCELAKFNGIRVVLCSVLPCDRFSWRPEIKPAAAVAELNTMLRQYAAEHKIPYVDYHAAFDNGSGGLDARFSQDGCHPTLYGYTLMEPMVVEGINKALRTKQARYTTPTPNE